MYFFVGYIWLYVVIGVFSEVVGEYRFCFICSVLGGGGGVGG